MSALLLLTSCIKFGLFPLLEVWQKLAIPLSYPDIADMVNMLVDAGYDSMTLQGQTLNKSLPLSELYEIVRLQRKED